MLFEVAILYNPTKKELEDGTGQQKLVFGPTAVIARDQQAAAINAILDGKLDASLNRERLEVLVRPFS